MLNLAVSKLMEYKYLYMLVKLTLNTQGERFYAVTEKVQESLKEMVKSSVIASGVLVIQCAHTSCGICISESFDPNAKHDLEQFLIHLAPRNLSFIKHIDEGPDDSPSHMKSLCLLYTSPSPRDRQKSRMPSSA